MTMAKKELDTTCTETATPRLPQDTPGFISCDETFSFFFLSYRNKRNSILILLLCDDRSVQSPIDSTFLSSWTSIDVLFLRVSLQSSSQDHKQECMMPRTLIWWEPTHPRALLFLVLLFSIDMFFLWFCDAIGSFRNGFYVGDFRWWMRFMMYFFFVMKCSLFRCEGEIK